jgi:dTDP-D-glucose 4,6-dehydratase
MLRIVLATIVVNALNSKKIESELGWKPKISQEAGIRQTIDWYKDNRALHKNS